MNTTIREATKDDFAACKRLDLAYETEYVWQIDVRDEAGAIMLGFRTVRLPRLLRVAVPHPDLENAVARGEHVLLIETLAEVRGYLVWERDPDHSIGWVRVLAVDRGWRRQRLGTGLLQAVYARARDAGLDRLMLETQTKNYPGICFAQNSGLVFCGYNDRYYPDSDIAIFFGQYVRL